MIEFAIKSQLLPYDTAWLYCVTCTHNNKYDWRFPTIADVTAVQTIVGIHGWFYVTPVRDL